MNTNSAPVVHSLTPRRSFARFRMVVGYLPSRRRWVAINGSTDIPVTTSGAP